jgi:hypothetical protein
MLTKKFWITSVMLSVLIFLTIESAILPSLSYNTSEHVYYGYVPPTTDVAGGEGDYPREVDELIKGTVISYTVPSGVAILDVVGLEDNTYIEIWDIYSNVILYSEVINKLEKSSFTYRPDHSLRWWPHKEWQRCSPGALGSLNQRDQLEEPAHFIHQ